MMNNQNITHIRDLEIITQEPNFTIVLPVDCNADCSFCSWRTSNQDKQVYNDKIFFNGLINALENLPDSCTQITISGGEPSVYKKLEEVMSIIAYHKLKNIQKIVFTTNGQNLLNLSTKNWFTNVVDFVNISRHDWNQDNNDLVFGIKTITWKDIQKISNNLAKEGIPTNINCVLSDSINPIYNNGFIKSFVKNARKNFINSITFRRDYDDGFGIHPLETLMGNPSSIGECPVCRKSRYFVKGMEVLFTTSEFEPTDVLGKQVYEFILQPNGDLTTNWEGTEVVDLKPITTSRPKESRTISDFLKSSENTENTMSCTAVRIKMKEKREIENMSCGAKFSSSMSCG